MKKIYLLVLLVNFSLQAQDWKVAEKSVTGVFTVEKSKSELFALINKWISINYNSAQNVIQMNDAESGTIIIKGINEVVYSNLPGKLLAPSYTPDKTSTKFNHTIEINVKENKFRVIYTLTGVSTDPNGAILSTQFFDCVNLTGENTVAVTAYNEVTEKYLKQGLIGKQKREKYKQAVIDMFKEINTTLVENMKATMLSITNSTKTEDKW